MTQAELLMADRAREVWTQTMVDLVRSTSVALDLMDAEPDEAERQSTAAYVRQAMKQAQENTRDAFRAELGLQVDLVDGALSDA